MVTIIVAVNEVGIIGRKGKIPWHLPDDMRRFKELTTGNVVIMGRKTWESLPKKPLPNRFNIVLSKQFVEQHEAFYRDLTDKHVGICSSLEEAIYMAEHECPGKEIFIMGGAQTYKAALDSGLWDRILMTVVNCSFEDILSIEDDDARWPTGMMDIGMLPWARTDLGRFEGFSIREYRKK